MIETPTFPLKPLVENWVWQSQAACQGMDTTSFFHPPRERGKTRRDRVAAAKRICHQCPVIAQCLEHALQVREPYGVWGGRSEEERAVLLGVVSLRYPQEGPPGARRDRPSRRTPALSGTAP